MLIGVMALVVSAALGADESISVKPIAGQADIGHIEVLGVSAGTFNPALWDASTPSMLPDLRYPVLAPRLGGLFRNIYAPSAVRTPDGWRVFYGAWDGVPTGNDRIYCVDTSDFLDFGPRRTIIEHGSFQHACNVNAFRNGDGSYELMCTVYPDERNTNKPAYFKSLDGEAWSGRSPQRVAEKNDIVEIKGYDKYPEADINGVNVLLREGKDLRLYFNSYTDFGRVYRASGDGRVFQFEGPALECRHAVNDVKKLRAADKDWYLMGLHMNGQAIWYSLSNDGMHFKPEHELLKNLGDDDRYIVAVGWVVDGNRVLGVLYGAGAVPELNRNRIFARWLQRRVVFISDDGTRCEPVRAMGPDRQVLPIPKNMKPEGHFEVYAEDGTTKLAGPIPAKVMASQVFQLVAPTEKTQ